MWHTREANSSGLPSRGGKGTCLTIRSLKLSESAPVRGNRAAIISQLGGGAGGVAVSAADVCSRYGLAIPRLGKKTQDRLNAVIRGAGTILRNPFDLGLAGRLPNILGEVLDILDDESHVDFIMLNE